jgi:hypothetical protein
MNPGNDKDYSKTVIRVTVLFKDGARKYNLKLKHDL